MDENLVGYLVGSLDEQTHNEVENYLATDPDAPRRLELLRQALEPLAADAEPITPPPGLVIRTLGRVAEHIAHRELPKAPVRTQAPVVERAFWRRADVLVAASILLTVLGVGIPALLHLRNAGVAHRIECQNNLREIYVALRNYHDNHRHFPDITGAGPHKVAGMVVPILADAGFWPPKASVRCPGHGPRLAVSIALRDLNAMDPEQFKTLVTQLIPGYAYSLGYVDSENVYRAPRLDPNLPNNLLPLLSDAPPPGEALSGNSPNHGATGQNVLFQDGHVRYTTVRTVGLNGDDIFLNQNKRVAAGLDKRDSVLGRSAASPDGN